MCLKTKANNYLQELKKKWIVLQNTPNIFAYSLNVTQRKYLPGKYNFYSEYNPERTSLRRPPQTIPSLNPKFNEEKFNFKKINPLELMLNIPYDGIDISLIINRSPLTLYHTLICPDVKAGCAQRITSSALKFSVEFLLNLADKAYRIGYNSPGALASVNHLHLHLMYIDWELYIDQAQLKLLTDNYIYRLEEDMPTEAICFLIDKTNQEDVTTARLLKIYKFLMWLCEQNIPHNLFLTKYYSSDGCIDSLKIFVYMREQYCVIKDLSSYNVAFCEFSGYVPIGDQGVFDGLTEQEVISKIKEESAGVYKRIYKYFNN